MNPACSGQLSISVFRASVVPGAGRWPSGCSRGAGGVPSDGVWLVMDQAGNSWPARLWRHTSLMQRMAFVALVPTLITAGLLVTLLTQRQLVSLRRMAQTNADSIATQTASVFWSVGVVPDIPGWELRCPLPPARYLQSYGQNGRLQNPGPE